MRLRRLLLGWRPPKTAPDASGARHSRAAPIGAGNRSSAEPARSNTGGEAASVVLRSAREPAPPTCDVLPNAHRHVIFHAGHCGHAARELVGLTTRAPGRGGPATPFGEATALAPTTRDSPPARVSAPLRLPPS